MTTVVSPRPSRTGAGALTAISQTAIRAYNLRYDRMAGLLSLASAVTWLLLLIAGWSQPGGPGTILPIEPELRTMPEAGHVAVAALLGLALVDGAVGAALLRGVRGARTIGRIRAALGVGLAILYLLASRNFMIALAIGAVQGLILVLLTRNAGLLLVYPGMLFLVVFFVLPLFSILAYSMGQGTTLGTVDMSTPSLENYTRILEPVGRSGLVYVNIILRTLWIAFLNTVICLLIAYPFAFWMARQPERMRNTLILLVMIPFWTNLLVRTYAWLVILRGDGLINNLLVDVLGVIDKPLELTNTPGALMLGLVYGYLPYMILPLYNTIERLDGRLTEAASDLYARPAQAFWRITLPLTLPGIVAGSILVFIPSVGTYVVTNVLGGGKYFLIGNLLEQQFLGSSGNKAFGAAFGVVLTVLMLIATLFYFRLGRKEAHA